MKLVTDDGELIDEIHNDAGIVIALPDGDIAAILPKLMDDSEATVPLNVQFCAALLVFLRNDDNYREVMRHLPRRRRGSGYKAN